MKARIIIGANYGDEGKGTVVATYTSKVTNVLNVLTNGGAQRGHSILTEDGSITFQHFGSGTYHGADSYYSRFYILNPMQFVREYSALIVKPQHIYRDKSCRWSTPYDSMANLISEELQKRQCSCGMGIWNTIKRYNSCSTVSFDDFITMENSDKMEYLFSIRTYYENTLSIPDKWKSVWSSPNIAIHFINDCYFMYKLTTVQDLKTLTYNEIIFENGQGLLLCDTGKDTYDTTPSNTGIDYSIELLKDLEVEDITAHYVTRPYLTRHGGGYLDQETNRKNISSSVEEDRTNQYNENQGKFRFGLLDISSLHDRILTDAKTIKYELEVTHCDEMDRVSEFKKFFDKVNTYNSPLVI